MIVSLKKKGKVIYKIQEMAARAISVVVATFSGVGVNEITTLRKEMRDVGTHICVVRNTLLRRVIDKTEFLCLKEILVGQNIVAFFDKNPIEAIRIFIKFSKKNENFKIKGAVLEGKFLDASQVSFLSNLPTHKESLMNLILVMKMSSVGNLIRVLHFLSFSR